MEIENDRQTKTVNLYNAATSDYNVGINGLNEFINYRNKQFAPSKTDPEIQQMLDQVNNAFKAATAKVAQIEPRNANTKNMIGQLTKAIEDAAAQLKEQQNWLKLYLSKSKSGRKSMFYKVTYLGIPLN